MTVIDIPERWDELSDDSRVRLHLEASDNPRDEGRVRVPPVVPRQEPIRGFADQYDHRDGRGRRTAPRAPVCG